MDGLSTHPEFPAGYLLDTIKLVMKTIMRTIHFEFGNLNFIQLMGTTMGTSAVCMWATLYYGHHVVKVLLPNFQHYLHVGKLTCWIDNIVGIWVCNECKCWKNCKHGKNICGKPTF